jgi:phospholipid transport system substrate-binding protein
MIQRFLLLSALVLFSSIIGDTPRSLAAANDPAHIVGDLGGRAISVLQNGDTAAVKQEQFRQLFRQYFDVEACARFALGTYWRTATTLQRQEFVELYEDYVVVSYSTALRALGGASFGVLGSQSDREGVIVSSRVQINGGAPIRIDWRNTSEAIGIIPSEAAAAVSTIGRMRFVVASITASQGCKPLAMSISIWSIRITELRMIMPLRAIILNPAVG